MMSGGEYMGKKSRLKKERKYKEISSSSRVVLEMSKSGEVSAKDAKMDDGTDLKVYRFFKEKCHAEALCKGDVWISTLKTCREYEDPLQGDPDEAKHIYRSGYMVGGSEDADLVKVAARSGIMLGPGSSNITLKDNVSIIMISDAFVLCTTKEFNPEALSDTFGMYCVEISNPSKFMELLSFRLNEMHPLKCSLMGDVAYEDREYTGLEDPPGVLGFVKPFDKYSSQKEFRFIWEAKDPIAIKPLLVSCSMIAGLCRQVA